MIGVSVAALRNWEQGRRTLGDPAFALLKVAAANREAVKLAWYRPVMPGTAEPGLLLTLRPKYCDQGGLICGRTAAASRSLFRQSRPMSPRRVHGHGRPVASG
jgi:hypothetical protein